MPKSHEAVPGATLPVTNRLTEIDFLPLLVSAQPARGQASESPAQNGLLPALRFDPWQQEACRPVDERLVTHASVEILFGTIPAPRPT